MTPRIAQLIGSGNWLGSRGRSGLESAVAPLESGAQPAALQNRGPLPVKSSPSYRWLPERTLTFDSGARAAESGGASSVSMGVGASSTFGAIPGTLAGLSAVFEFVPRRSWLGLRGRVQGTQALESPVKAEEIEISPLLCALQPLSRVRLGVCAGAELGHLLVRGVEYSGPQSAWWVAPAAGATLRYSIGTSTWLELASEVGVPLITRSYWVKASDYQFETAPVVGRLELYAGANL